MKKQVKKRFSGLKSEYEGLSMVGVNMSNINANKLEVSKILPKITLVLDLSMYQEELTKYEKLLKQKKEQLKENIEFAKRQEVRVRTEAIENTALKSEALQLRASNKNVNVNERLTNIEKRQARLVRAKGLNNNILNKIRAGEVDDNHLEGHKLIQSLRGKINPLSDFKGINKDGNNKIELSEFKTLVKQYQRTVSDDAIAAAYKIIDSKVPKGITYTELKDAFSGTSQSALTKKRANNKLPNGPPLLGPRGEVKQRILTRPPPPAQLGKLIIGRKKAPKTDRDFAKTQAKVAKEKFELNKELLKLKRR